MLIKYMTVVIATGEEDGVYYCVYIDGKMKVLTNGLMKAVEGSVCLGAIK